MMLKPYGYALVSHENLSGSAQTRILGARHLRQIGDTPQALLSILFPQASLLSPSTESLIQIPQWN